MTVKQLWTNILQKQGYIFRWENDTLIIDKTEQNVYMMQLNRDLRLNYTDFVTYNNDTEIKICTY